jgi:hypothetical protein
MAVIYPYRIRSARAVSIYTLPIMPGRAYLVRRIAVMGCAVNGFATITNGPSTVGFYQVGALAWNHLGQWSAGEGGSNIFDVFRMLGLAGEIPVAEGDALIITLPGEADLVMVEYAEVEPADVVKTAPFGREGKELPLVLYGTNAAAQAASGYQALTASLLPAQLTAFPYGQVAETSRKYTIHGIVAQDIEGNEFAAAADHYWRTTYLRMTLERETIYDVDRNGFPMIGDGAAAGSINAVYGGGLTKIPWAAREAGIELFRLPVPLVVGPGEELVLEQGFEVVDGAGAAANVARVGLIAVMAPAA